jgi:DNA repair protein RadA
VLKAKKVLADSGALIKEFSTADQVLERRKSLVRFTTGSKNLDDFLKGGVESQAITELAGEFGSGKSQIYHTLCVTAAKGTQGQINSIIFVDTENTFRPERVHQIVQSAAAMVTGFGYAFLAAALLTGIGIIFTALLKQEKHRQASIVDRA